MGYYSTDGKRYVSDQEVRRGKNGINDINGFGGYIAYTIPATCCCPGGRNGAVKLIQLIDKTSNSKLLVDIDNPEKKLGKTENPLRRIGYVESGGRQYPKYSNAYIDAPGLVEKTLGEGLRVPYSDDYKARIKIEAFCQCPHEDVFLHQSTMFWFLRDARDRDGEIIFIYENRTDSRSDYPHYTPRDTKGLDVPGLLD